MPSFDHFNFIAPVYDKIFRWRQNKKILELADIDDNSLILDIGGGTGRVSIFFQINANRVWIADSAFKMLREAKKKGLVCVNAMSEQLPFDAGIFDGVIIVDAFHHVADHDKTVNEIWRSISLTGKIIIEEPDIRHWVVKLIALGEKLMLMRSKFLDPHKIAAMFQQFWSAKTSVYRHCGIVWVIITKTNPTGTEE